MGGNLARIPSGIITAILVNIGAMLILKTTVFLRFRTMHVVLCFELISIFLLTYYNMGIAILHSFEKNNSDLDFYPSPFTPLWLLFWDKSIQTSMIISSLMPYAGPFL